MISIGIHAGTSSIFHIRVNIGIGIDASTHTSINTSIGCDVGILGPRRVPVPVPVPAPGLPGQLFPFPSATTIRAIIVS